MLGLSYSRGPDAPLLEQTISEVLSGMVARAPDHEALVVQHQNARLTYRNLYLCVDSVALGLA